MVDDLNLGPSIGGERAWKRAEISLGCLAKVVFQVRCIMTLTAGGGWRVNAVVRENSEGESQWQTQGEGAVMGKIELLELIWQRPTGSWAAYGTLRDGNGLTGCDRRAATCIGRVGVARVVCRQYG